MMTTQYVTNRTRIAGKRSAWAAPLFALVSVLIMLITMLTPALAIDNSVSADEGQKDSRSIGERVICWMELGDAVDFVRNIPFYTLSKSAYASGIDRVDSGLNSMLNLGKSATFSEINQRIVGYPLGVSVDQEDSVDPKEKYNQGEKVNPFDRFGVAGLNWSVYGGEFRHKMSDVCNKNGGNDVAEQANVFYENRLDPKGTWLEISKGDVRSYTKLVMLVPNSRTNFAAGTIIANWAFMITKLIVVLTISLISFAFSDVVSFLGLSDLLAGDSGLFRQLYDGIFTPLIVLIFIFTGIYVAWVGIVKRQVREAAVATIRSVALFIVAVVLAINPLATIKLPNNVAVVAQAFILTTFSQSMSSGNGICATDVGSFQRELAPPDANGYRGYEESRGILDQATDTMRSTISCQLWKSFLFNPWVEGQFGRDFNTLWAKEKIAPWAKTGATEVNNSDKNANMVGDAEVPMGGGAVINNWALFQLSTQTDVHASPSTPGQPPLRANGFNNDWYRVVDLMANYSETEAQAGDSKINVPSGDPATEGFVQWAGFNPLTRFWVAASSAMFATVGVAAPLIFAGLSSMYALGIAVLMGFAPIMLLLGCWAGRGYEIFKGWLESVVNTTMKRIGTGLVLTISLIITNSLLEAIDDAGWWATMLSLVLFTFLLIKTRHSIISAIGSFHFASTPFAATASNIGSKYTGFLKSTAKTSAGMAGAAAVGGFESRRQGGSAFKGAFKAVRHQTHNLAYRSQYYRKMAQTYDKVAANRKAFDAKSGNLENYDNDILAGNKQCVYCGVTLAIEDGMFDGGIDQNGNLCCALCRDSGDVEGVEHFSFYVQTDESREDQRKQHAGKPSKRLDYDIRDYLASQQEYGYARYVSNLAQVASGEQPGSVVAEVEKTASETGRYMARFETEYKRSSRIKKGNRAEKTVGISSLTHRGLTLPPELSKYIDQTQLAKSFIEGNVDAASRMLANGMERLLLDSNVTNDDMEALGSGVGIADKIQYTMSQARKEERKLIKDHLKDKDNTLENMDRLFDDD